LWQLNQETENDLKIIIQNGNETRKTGAFLAVFFDNFEPNEQKAREVHYDHEPLF